MASLIEALGVTLGASLTGGVVGVWFLVRMANLAAFSAGHLLGVLANPLLLALSLCRRSGASYRWWGWWAGGCLRGTIAGHKTHGVRKLGVPLVVVVDGLAPSMSRVCWRNGFCRAFWHFHS